MSQSNIRRIRESKLYTRYSWTSVKDIEMVLHVPPFCVLDKNLIQIDIKILVC